MSEAIRPRRASRLLAGLFEPDDRYTVTAWLFLRFLALIYLAAFVSVALEIDGLVGPEGILPAADYLDGLHQRFGDIAWLRFPTLFWLHVDTTSLLVASYAGCLFSLLLLFGWRPALSAGILFVLYLSLTRVGQVFFNFQWDYLLLEAGFLAIFLTTGPNRVLVFLFHWLLFRLRFLSGYAKLESGDPSWSGLTALQHYFETQPLPHMGAWYVHQLPDWLLRAATGATLFVELVVPFFIFLPRPFRLTAAALTIAVQLLIIATSNHNFINLLTIALCLFLLDDKTLRFCWPFADKKGKFQVGNRLLRSLTLAPVAVFLVIASGLSIHGAFAGGDALTRWDSLSNWARGWGLANVYHVFPTMQTERHELVIEGSNDGRDWRPYRFRYKPDAVTDRPRFNVPLQPRLDWMMWFLPPQNPTMRRWFEPFLWRLQHNAAPVVALLEHNPFPTTPPRYLRVMSYRFRFTSVQERDASGLIWKAELLGQFPRVPARRP